AIRRRATHAAATTRGLATVTIGAWGAARLFTFSGRVTGTQVIACGAYGRIPLSWITLPLWAAVAFRSDAVAAVNAIAAVAATTAVGASAIHCAPETHPIFGAS